MTKLVTDISDRFIVSTKCGFIPQQSDAKMNRYVFYYEVTIQNNSNYPCQLMSRHWIIQDADKKIEEVYGEGVIGEQPLIQPGEKYQYTSGAVLKTEMGTMEGRYFMTQKPVGEESIEFEIFIPKFTLSVPRTLH